MFSQDYLFKSPSAAAAFVLGANANGWSKWKDKDGNTLSDIYGDHATDDSNDDRQKATVRSRCLLRSSRNSPVPEIDAVTHLTIQVWQG